MATKTNLPLALKVLQTVFPLVERVAPARAKKWATHMFYRPLRFRPPEAESQKRITAIEEDIQVAGNRIKVYSWGQGPVVLCVHGWSGRGLQFREFIYPLVARGYQVVTFDSPAHGHSSGSETNLVEMSKTLLSVSERYDDIVGVVSHSMGGVAAMMAAEKGLKCNKISMIAVPPKGLDIINGFSQHINASWQISNHLIGEVEQRFATGMSTFDAVYHLEREALTNKQIQLIFDQDDEEVRFDSVQRMIDLVPSEHVMITEGLGHTRILRAPDVISKVEKFIQAKPAKAVKSMSYSEAIA